MTISSFNICISAVHIIFMFRSFCGLGLTQQIGLLPIFLNNSLQFFLFQLYLVLISKKQKKLKLWKVWTQESFQKGELDRPGERSPE